MALSPLALLLEEEARDLAQRGCALGDMQREALAQGADLRGCLASTKGPHSLHALRRRYFRLLRPEPRCGRRWKHTLCWRTALTSAGCATAICDGCGGFILGGAGRYRCERCDYDLCCACWDMSDPAEHRFSLLLEQVASDFDGILGRVLELSLIHI